MALMGGSNQRLIYERSLNILILECKNLRREIYTQSPLLHFLAPSQKVFIGAMDEITH